MAENRNKEMLTRFLGRVDWTLIVSAGVLVVIGMFMVFSALLRFENAGAYISKQFFGVLLGMFCLMLFAFFNYQVFKAYYVYLYILSLLILAAVLVVGTRVHGSKSWISLGFFSFQPYEITKILFILALAGYLDKMAQDLFRWQRLMVPVLFLLGNVGLILLQPDFSSSLVYFPIFLVMLYAAGARLLHLSGVTFYGAVTVSLPLIKTFMNTNERYAPIIDFFRSQLHVVMVVLGIGAFIFLLWWMLKQLMIYIPLIYFIFVFGIIVAGVGSSYVVDHSMKEYQKKRLIVFLNPRIDPLGSGYNIIQSQVAVGSGRLFGKGIFNGTQGQLGFVPARHTDFIFSLVGEELGFFISELVVGFYFLLVWRASNVARHARDRFGSLVATGIAGMFAFYGVINMGMVMGLMPITGLPLSFFSYGGSHMVASLISVGLLLSVSSRRYMY